MTYDVTIIGGGIVGLATAYQLLDQHPNLKLCLIEKEKGLVQHQTSNNSGVIHSGIYYTPGGDKAVNCRRGYQLLLEFCERENIAYDLCGKVIVATKEEELPLLENIYQRGIQNGLTQIKRINSEELKDIEPHSGGIKAIHVPEAGIISYKKVGEKYAALIRAKGGEIVLGERVEEIREEGILAEVVTSSKTISTKLVVVCAGLYADKITQMTLPKTDFLTAPFRGEYYELIPEKRKLVNGLIYPVPDPNFPFLGVHFTKMIDGRVEAGPNAVLAFKREGYKNTDVDFKEFIEILKHKGFRKLAMKHWRKELFEIYRSFSKRAFVNTLKTLIPEVTGNDLVKGKAGVRAQAIDINGGLIDDFMILESKKVLHLCNAPSPAATSSLAIGEKVAGRTLTKLSSL